METKAPQFPSSVCFYVPMCKHQVDALELIKDSGQISVEGCWENALECLAEASNQLDVVTVLFGDLAFDGNARWIAVIHNVEIEDERVEITVHCLRELPHQFPAVWLRRLDSTDKISELNAGDAALCESPIIVARYLAENEITSDYDPHPLLFSQSVMIRQLSEEFKEAQPSDLVRCSLTSENGWKLIKELLEQASAEGKVLLAAFNDPQDKECLGWVTTIEEVGIDGDRKEIECYVICDFRGTEPRIPLSEVSKFGQVTLAGDPVRGDVEICEPSWLMNECLDLLDANTTVEDFSEALKTANLSTKQIAMLSYHYRAPNHTISMGRLAEAMGYKNFNAANLHYGKLAARIGELLGLAEDDYGDNINILAEPSKDKDIAGHFQWEMKSELAIALEQLGFVQVDGTHGS